MAAGEMVEAGVGDERAVVQLQHHQVLTGAGGQSQVPAVYCVRRPHASC